MSIRQNEQETEHHQNPEAASMVQLLTKGHEQVVKTCRQVLSIAQDADDESTAALVSDRMRIHEKTAWMLRATVA